jgi:hypothetical protein
MTRESDKTQAEIQKSVKKWGKATCFLGLALAICVGCWSFFFPSRALYRFWETWGRLFAIASLCTLLPFLYAAATTFNLWFYGYNLRKIDRDFAHGGKHNPRK